MDAVVTIKYDYSVNIFIRAGIFDIFLDVYACLAHDSTHYVHKLLW